MSDSAGAPKYKRGTHPQSLANLKPPWAPGYNGNPTGLKGPMITPRIQYLLGMDAEELSRWRPKTAADVVAWRYVQEAMAGGLLSERGRQEVIERIDGKVPEHLIISEEPAAVRSLRELQAHLRLVEGEESAGG